MPHRNRTLLMVVSLIWILALAGTLVSAAARTAGDEPGQAADSHEHDGGEATQQEAGAGEARDGGGQSGGDGHAGHEH